MLLLSFLVVMLCSTVFFFNDALLCVLLGDRMKLELAFYQFTKTRAGEMAKSISCSWKGPGLVCMWPPCGSSQLPVISVPRHLVLSCGFHWSRHEQSVHT